ncbi:MAG: choice-of-anchor R domain-containing protein [Chthonomonadales bacterium]
MFSRLAWRPLVVVTAAAALAAGPSRAQIVVFNNFGPGDAYNTGTGWTLGTGSNYIVGEQFTPSASGTLDKIELALGLMDGLNSAKVYLVADSSGQPGATVLENWTTTSMGVFGHNNPLLVFNSAAHPSLTSGTPYWIYVDATTNSPTTWAVWNWNSTGGTGPRASSTNGGVTWSVSPGDTQGAFRVTVQGPGGATPVPAAPVVSAIGAGVYALCFFRKRRPA